MRGPSSCKIKFSALCDLLQEAGDAEEKSQLYGPRRLLDSRVLRFRATMSRRKSTASRKGNEDASCNCDVFGES
eukprot:1349836-Pleurochrysis_carterae.AAC.9